MVADDLFVGAFWRGYMVQMFVQYWKAHCLDREYGGYVADFDREWEIAGPCCKSLVSQGRLVYDFSAGLRHARLAEYGEAAAHGVEFLRGRMADAEEGGWFWRCNRDGSVLEPVKHTYGHAFVIFGLSEYARATGTAEAGRVALETLEVLRERAGGRAAAGGGFGGFWTVMDRRWQPIERQRSQNPHMHLLEACLSLYDATGSKLALETAVEIAGLGAERFVNRRFGCLEELFAEDWSGLGDEEAAAVQVGHQFEWCWLLNRLADRTNQEHWRELGDRLMEWGLRYGTDREHGGFHNTCDRQGRLVDRGKSHWVESEALRALLYLIVNRGREDLRETFVRAAEFALEHLADGEYGGWYTSVNADGTPRDSRKGSEWKLDYHMTSLCDEAARVLG
jgi:mannose/cellobiose epimerase-like protein (N-acyl-D-glucosamine 2-epimerase family)